jgi:hypothetical protein
LAETLLHDLVVAENSSMSANCEDMTKSVSGWKERVFGPDFEFPNGQSPGKGLGKKLSKIAAVA